MELNALQVQQAAMGVLDIYERMVRLGVATDQDKALFAECARACVRRLRSSHTNSHAMTAADIVKEVTALELREPWLQQLQVALAREYRQRHGGQNPGVVWSINGKCMLNAYCLEADPWIRQFVMDTV